MVAWYATQRAHNRTIRCCRVHRIMKIDKFTDSGPQLDWLAGVLFKIEVCYLSKVSPYACTKTPKTAIPHRLCNYKCELHKFILKMVMVSTNHKNLQRIVKTATNLAQFDHVHISWHSLNPLYTLAVNETDHSTWVMCSYFYRYSWCVFKWLMLHTFALIKGHSLD